MAKKGYRPAKHGLRLPNAWEFKLAYERADGLRFEKTVEGIDKGRCESCLRIVTISPRKEADEHVCDPWWEKPMGYE